MYNYSDILLEIYPILHIICNGTITKLVQFSYLGREYKALPLTANHYTSDEQCSSYSTSIIY